MGSGYGLGCIAYGFMVLVYGSGFMVWVLWFSM